MVEDHTQYINPRKTPLVNASRMNKGDMKADVIDGHIRRANVIDNTIARNLVTRGFIEDFHYDYALDLMELRNALYGQLNAKTSLSLFINGGDVRISRSKALDIYEDVIRMIKRSGEKIIVRACTVDYEKDATAKMIQGITVYRNTFLALADALEEAISNAKIPLA